MSSKTPKLTQEQMNNLGDKPVVCLRYLGMNALNSYPRSSAEYRFELTVGMWLRAQNFNIAHNRGPGLLCGRTANSSSAQSRVDFWAEKDGVGYIVSCVDSSGTIGMDQVRDLRGMLQSNLGQLRCFKTLGFNITGGTIRGILAIRHDNITPEALTYAHEHDILIIKVTEMGTKRIVSE